MLRFCIEHTTVACTPQLVARPGLEALVLIEAGLRTAYHGYLRIEWQIAELVNEDLPGKRHVGGELLVHARLTLCWPFCARLRTRFECEGERE